MRSLRRLALTTKQAGKDYYKGNRTGSMGRHTKHGGYTIDFKKVRTYCVPADLASFTVRITTSQDTAMGADRTAQLSPFVAKRIEAPRGRLPEGLTAGEHYLERWKMENGQD